MADEQQIRVVALQSWKTAVLNENNMPLLTLDTFDGQSLTVFLTPEAAVELGESLQRTGEQVMQNPIIPN